MASKLSYYGEKARFDNRLTSFHWIWCFFGSRLVLLYLAPSSFDIHIESKYVKLLLGLEDYLMFVRR